MFIVNLYFVDKMGRGYKGKTQNAGITHNPAFIIYKAFHWFIFISCDIKKHPHWLILGFEIYEAF